MLVAVGAGVIAALGLYYTHRGHRHTEMKDHVQADLTREGQFTERYVEAINLLSSEENLTQRLGGIYSLERIMKDSEKDRATVIEVLSAFVRRQYPKGNGGEASPSTAGPPPPSTAAQTATPEEWSSKTVGGPVARQKPPEDVRAVLTVLARRPQPEEGPRPDLRGVNFSKVDLGRTDLPGANLAEANLQEANLEQVDLHMAYLGRADLREAYLFRAYLVGADLREVDLRWVDLPEADLRRANLEGANLEGADLAGAYLDGANLDGANLSEAHGLTVDQIAVARPYKSTQLPEALATEHRVTARIAACEQTARADSPLAP